jgi:hypothetical protein
MAVRQSDVQIYADYAAAEDAKKDNRCNQKGSHRVAPLSGLLKSLRSFALASPMTAESCQPHSPRIVSESIEYRTASAGPSKYLTAGTPKNRATVHLSTYALARISDVAITTIAATWIISVGAMNGTFHVQTEIQVGIIEKSGDNC